MLEIPLIAEVSNVNTPLLSVICPVICSEIVNNESERFIWKCSIDIGVFN